MPVAAGASSSECLHLKPKRGPEHRTAVLVSHFDRDFATDRSGDCVPSGVSKGSGCFITALFDAIELKPLVIHQKGFAVAVIEVVAGATVAATRESGVV